MWERKTIEINGGYFYVYEPKIEPIYHDISFPVEPIPKAPTKKILYQTLFDKYDHKKHVIH